MTTTLRLLTYLLLATTAVVGGCDQTLNDDAPATTHGPLVAPEFTPICTEASQSAYWPTGRATAVDVCFEATQAACDPADAALGSDMADANIAQACVAALAGDPAHEADAAELLWHFQVSEQLVCIMDELDIPQVPQHLANDPAVWQQLAQQIDQFLATANDMLFIGDIAGTMDLAPVLGARCVDACFDGLVSAFAAVVGCGGPPVVIPPAPVVPTTVPSHPTQADCHTLCDAADTLQAYADAIDCSALQAAYDAAQAAADAALDAMDAALADAVAADAALTDAQTALADATTAAQTAADAITDFVNSTIFSDSVNAGANPGGLPNSIGVGPMGGAGSLTIYFDGSSASVTMLTTVFASPAFQALKTDLTDAQKAMKAAQQAVNDALAAKAAADANATAAIAAAAAAQAAADAAKAALDACLLRKNSAQSAADAGKARKAQCEETLKGQTRSAVEGATTAADNAATAASDATGGGGNSSGGGGASVPGVDEAQDAADAAGAKADEAEELEENGEYDAAQAAAAEAEVLAGKTLSLLLGPCTEGAKKEILIGTEEVGRNKLQGVGSVGLRDYGTVHGGSQRKSNRRREGMMDAIKTAQGLTPPGKNMALGAYHAFQKAAAAAIGAKLTELAFTISERDQVLWIDFVVHGMWSVEAVELEHTYRIWECVGGTWIPRGTRTVGETQLGECVESSGSQVWRWTALSTHVGTITESVSPAVRDMLARTGWIVSTCPQ